MKLILMILILAASAHAELFITQVLPNPTHTESGGEAVELFNNASLPFNLSGLTLATSSSPKDVIFPSITIPPKQFFLIADAGWNESRDNSSWKSADLEDAITLKNTDGFVGILKNDSFLDLLGWGSGQSQGRPAPNPKEGFALKRINFTGDNAQDFVEAIPFFGTPTLDNTAVRQIIVDINIFDNTPSIHAITIPDEHHAEGIQVIPNVGKPKELAIVVDAEADQVIAELFGKRILLEKQGGQFSGLFLLNYTLLPGKYAVDIIADKQLQTITKRVTLELLPLLALDINTSYFNISGSPGDVIEADVVVENLGNVLVDLALKTDIHGLAYVGDEPVQLSEEAQIFDLDLDVAKKKKLRFKFTLPAEKTAGIITLIGVGS